MPDIVKEVLIKITTQLDDGLKNIDKQINEPIRRVKTQLGEFGAVLGMPFERWRKLNQIAMMSSNEFQKFAKSADPSFLKQFDLAITETGNLFRKSTNHFIGNSKAQRIMTKEITSGGGKIANTTRMLTQGMHGFRMEMLSVMFFGMGLQRMFMGLLQPALEAAGIFEIIATTLEVFFLPVALMLLDPLLALMDWFLGMPESVQATIGIIVLLGAALGALLFFIGNLTLGIGGLIGAFGPLMGSFGGIGGAISGLSATFGAIWAGMVAVAGSAVGAIVFIIGPLIVAIVLLYGAWQENSAGIMASLNVLFGVVQEIFGRLMNIIGGAIAFIQAIFRGDADEALQILKNIFKEGVGLVIDVFLKLPLAIADVLRNILWGIGAFTVKIGTTLFELGTKILQSIADGIRNAYGVVKTAISNIPIIGPILVAGLNVGEWIVGQVAGAASRIPNALANIGTGIWNGITGGISRVRPFQHGGLVTKPTLALLGERGPEMVTPLSGGEQGMVTISPTYYINASVGNNMDLRALANQLNELLVSDYRRLSFK